MLSRSRQSRSGRISQRGDILIIVLIALVVCVMGLLSSMRQTLFSTQMTGNVLARQKEVQVADIAVRMIDNIILTTYGGINLEIGSYTQPWYRDVPATTAGPTAAYWASCLGSGDPTARCAAEPLIVNGNTLPYTALVVVQPTALTDSGACGLPPYIAHFYDIYVYITDAAGTSTASTETVYQLCVA